LLNKREINASRLFYQQFSALAKHVNIAIEIDCSSTSGPGEQSIPTNCRLNMALPMTVPALPAFVASNVGGSLATIGSWQRAGELQCCPYAPPRSQPQPRRGPGARSMPTMMAKAKKVHNYAPRVENRIARMRYEFLETHECGIELLGTEIKAVRMGQMNIRDGYARVDKGELFLHNVHITPFEKSSAYFNHEATRVRKLLLHKRDILKLAARQKDAGLTIVPIKAYFNKSGFLKIEVALCRGKQLHDRREDIKNRDNAREMQAIIKASLNA
jgi:SsrA-binding protein